AYPAEFDDAHHAHHGCGVEPARRTHLQRDAARSSSGDDRFRARRRYRAGKRAARQWRSADADGQTSPPQALTSKGGFYRVTAGKVAR
ncbi:MAG: hypothetical protein QOF36_1848, partial [Microbacteriaceae bacterium]|nr:hypothetical protein [Microbacteriaceae bacterium]